MARLGKTRFAKAVNNGLRADIVVPCRTRPLDALQEVDGETLSLLTFQGHDELVKEALAIMDFKILYYAHITRLQSASAVRRQGGD